MSLEAAPTRVTRTRTAKRAPAPLDAAATPGPGGATSEEASHGAASAPATDTLIFLVAPTTLSLVGGSGRGAGWMGIVDLPIDGEPIAAKVLGSSRPFRMDAEAEPARIVGPYWASHALLVPVGGEHLVVFGGSQPLADTDATLVRLATQLVADLVHVPADKLLGDELEVVQAIRDMMDCRVESVTDVARHVAMRAADPLSCEMGAVLFRSNGNLVAEVVTRDWPARLEKDAIRSTLIRLFARVERGALLEQELEAAADDALGRNQGLLARFAVPIGGSEPFGVLVVAHAATRPRGFTSLCQRIGYALAYAAAPLLTQASSREALALERDRYAQEARTDPLTGLDNRAAWNVLLASETERHRRYKGQVTVVSADVDGLKEINDRDGHAAGDRAIKAAAELLRRSARASDRVARVGGDEFLVLMPNTGEIGGKRYLERVRAGMPVVLHGTGCHGMSLGMATTKDGESLASTVQRADAAMYASKSRNRTDTHTEETPPAP